MILGWVYRGFLIILGCDYVGVGSRGFGVIILYLVLDFIVY